MAKQISAITRRCFLGVLALGPMLVSTVPRVFAADTSKNVGPDAAAFATIDVPALLVAARESPVPQREMTDAMAAALPRAQVAVVDGGHLIDPASPAVLAFVEAVARG